MASLTQAGAEILTELALYDIKRGERIKTSSSSQCHPLSRILPAYTATGEERRGEEKRAEEGERGEERRGEEKERMR